MAEDITKAQQESTLPAPQEQPDQFVDELMGVSKEQQDVPAPATAENQAATSEAQEFNEKLRSKKAMLARNTGRSADKISDLEAQDLVLRDIKKEEEKAARKAKEQEEADFAKKAEVDMALQKYQELKEEYAQRGMNFKVDENFETMIAQKEQTAARDIAEAKEAEAAELEKQQALEEAQERQRVEQEKEILQKQQAQQIAQDEVQKQKVEKLAQRQKKLEEQIAAEDMEMKKIDPNRFWNSKTTGQKIMAGIGMVLAGMGAGAAGGRNTALDIIQGQIDDDIRAQKLNNEQILAKKKHALNMVELELKKLDSSTNNQLKKMQINKMIHDMQQGQVALDRQRMMAKKLSSSEGLTRDEALTLDREDQKRLVPIGERNYIAFNPEVAKKLNNEVIPSAKASLRGLGRLKEILDMPAAEIRPTLRAEASSIKQALKGNLRLELFGPGVMTDFESKMADKIIGDPTAILALDMAERAKFNALIDKVKFSTRDKIKQAGINLPKSQNDRMIEQMQKNNPKMKRELIIDALMKKGFWKTDELGF